MRTYYVHYVLYELITINGILKKQKSKDYDAEIDDLDHLCTTRKEALKWRDLTEDCWNATNTRGVWRGTIKTL